MKSSLLPLFIKSNVYFLVAVRNSSHCTACCAHLFSQSTYDLDAVKFVSRILSPGTGNKQLGKNCCGQDGEDQTFVHGDMWVLLLQTSSSWRTPGNRCYDDIDI